MARRARPTLRCLREDLGQTVPPADTPLDEVPHPLLAKATERFADEATPRERIAAVDDHVLFKVKVQRWRSAVWMADDGIPRLVAAGQREEGIARRLLRLARGPRQGRPQPVQRGAHSPADHRNAYQRHPPRAGGRTALEGRARGPSRTSPPRNRPLPAA